MNKLDQWSCLFVIFFLVSPLPTFSSASEMDSSRDSRNRKVLPTRTLETEPTFEKSKVEIEIPGNSLRRIFAYGAVGGGIGSLISGGAVIAGGAVVAIPLVAPLAAGFIMGAAYGIVSQHRNPGLDISGERKYDPDLDMHYMGQSMEELSKARKVIEFLKKKQEFQLDEELEEERRPHKKLSPKQSRRKRK